MNSHKVNFKLNDQQITIETGTFAPQANGAVTVRCGDTMVLATVVTGSPREGIDYFPLQVEYREKHYAGGIISSSRFVKREGRPSDNEILTSRLIDRSIRPLFPEGYMDEVQVVINPLSIDGQHEPEILAIIGASAALAISDIPWAGPVGAVRVGLDKDSKFIINPTQDQKETSQLDMVISGSADSIAMVEADGNEVAEAQILEAFKTSQSSLGKAVEAIKEMVSLVKPKKMTFKTKEVNPEISKIINKEVPDLLEIARAEVTKTGSRRDVVQAILEKNPDLDSGEVNKVFDKLSKEAVRKQTLEKGIRPDGRKPDEIRPINCYVGTIPRVHGSGYFQRGLTHVLSVVTLASPDKEQLIDGMKGQSTRRYIHHYNFPGFSVGEPSRVGYPGRREVGHGALAERALFPMIPDSKDFPYTIRVVSEVMSGNGSTSQASICGSTLSLMDAGVPLKKPVAGIAMGLITDGSEKHVTLSDIAGLEDHTGDMDFKVAGTRDGITAIQMDVKISGVTADLLGEALEQARVGRIHILEKMVAVIDKPRKDISEFAPHIKTIIINPEKIGEVIGPGGKVIRQLQSDFEVDINVEDSGEVNVTGASKEKVNQVLDFIKGITTEPEVGKVYAGTATRVESYGAFIEFMPGKTGLIHISKIASGYLGDINTVIKEGDSIEVKLQEIDDQGRLNLVPTKPFEGGPAGSVAQNPKPDFKSPNQSHRPDYKRFKDHR